MGNRTVLGHYAVVARAIAFAIPSPIESSYRVLRRGRVKTPSRNPALRFFLLGFALLLVNLWAYLRWFVARLPGSGPLRIAPTRFQFQLFISLLRRFIERLYEATMTVPLTDPSLKS